MEQSLHPIVRQLLDAPDCCIDAERGHLGLAPATLTDFSTAERCAAPWMSVGSGARGAPCSELLRYSMIQHDWEPSSRR